MLKKASPAQEAAAEKRYLQRLEAARNSTHVNPFESESDQAARIERAKKDYNFFCRTYFPIICEHDCPPFHIENAHRIKANKHCRELMAMGSGMAKSMNYTTLVPLWIMLQGELKTMLVCSINSDKAIELLDPIRAELEGNALLIHDFGKQKKEGAWEAKHFQTQNGCGFFALGIGQSPRGVRQHQSRVDYLVFDDCDDKAVCRNPKRLAQHTNWCLEDALGTTSPRGSRVIFVNNIFAEQTILTTIRDTRNDAGAWHYTQVNATDENGKATWDYPGAQEYYDSLRAAMGPLSFASEYNNTPYAKGTVFTDELIQWAELPPLDKFEAIVGHWDVAFTDTKTADFNAVQVWGLYQKNYYMIDCFTKKSQLREVIRWIFLKKIETENQARILFFLKASFGIKA